MDPIKKLSAYGVVKTCKVVANTVVTIVITSEFYNGARNTFELLKDCTDLFPDYPILETCITEEKLAIIVLSKKD